MEQLTDTTTLQTSANLLICDGIGYIQLSAFSDILSGIACGSDTECHYSSSFYLLLRDISQTRNNQFYYW